MKAGVKDLIDGSHLALECADREAAVLTMDSLVNGGALPCHSVWASKWLEQQSRTAPPGNSCLLGPDFVAFGVALWQPRATSQICLFGWAQHEQSEAAAELVQRAHLSRTIDIWNLWLSNVPLPCTYHKAWTLTLLGFQPYWTVLIRSYFLSSHLTMISFYIIYGFFLTNNPKPKV